MMKNFFNSAVIATLLLVGGVAGGDVVNPNYGHIHCYQIGYCLA